MKNISVLDVTLRDGGCVNNFDFGADYMHGILAALEASAVDFIEVGYIDSKNGSESERTQYVNEKVIPQALSLVKKPGRVYLAMMDFGKFDPQILSDYDGSGIDGVRLAFHKRDWRAAVELGATIIDKGYKLFVQPMLTLHYSDRELIDLIETVNAKLPNASAFYIVDSFGEMRGNDLLRMLGIVEHNLRREIAIGLHSHNNLSLSYSLAMTFLEHPTDRKLIVDSSIMGMGKGAGNLCTELLMEHLNLYHDGAYHIASILSVVDRVIKVIHQERPWGYSVEYYLSSINHCSPSYAGHFYRKHMLTIDQVGELLGMIADDKKISFDKEYAEELYSKYRENSGWDDSDVVEKLRAAFAGKSVLLIAPGKSITSANALIASRIKSGKVLSIGLNNFKFETDYVLVTRPEMLEEALTKNVHVITTSRLCRSSGVGVDIVNYRKWICVDEEVHDSSAVIALNLLRAFSVDRIQIAGMDGYDLDINENYFSKIMRRTITETDVKRRNDFYRNFIASLAKVVPVEFLTQSKYMPMKQPA